MQRDKSRSTQESLYVPLVTASPTASLFLEQMYIIGGLQTIFFILLNTV